MKKIYNQLRAWLSVLQQYLGYLSLRVYFPKKKDIDAKRYKKLLSLLSQYVDNANGDISEKLLLKNILSLKSKRAHDVMTPRVDIVGFNDDIELNQMMKVIKVSGLSRFPIYKDNLDYLIGFIHVKDLISYIDHVDDFNLHNILRELLFVSPYMKMIDLLYEMKFKRIHMAIVVDEFGGIDGLITIEDVVEQIVGEIIDEHDKKPTNLIRVVKKKFTLIADGRTEIEYLETYTGDFVTEQEKEDNNTIAGLIVYLLGYIPMKNEVILHPSGVEFRVLSVLPSKINTVLIDYSRLYESKD